MPACLPGLQVVEQNKRHLCTYQVLNQTTHEPWRWWHYAAGECWADRLGGWALAG